jgi:hypothetical protein
MASKKRKALEADEHGRQEKRMIKTISSGYGGIPCVEDYVSNKICGDEYNGMAAFFPHSTELWGMTILMKKSYHNREIVKENGPSSE